LNLFAYDGGPMYPAVVFIIVLSFIVHLCDSISRRER